MVSLFPSSTPSSPPSLPPPPNLAPSTKILKVIPDVHVTPAFLRQGSIPREAPQKETTFATVILPDSREDANRNTEPYIRSSQLSIDSISNDEKRSEPPAGVDAPESVNRDQEMQALREANDMLTQRLAQITEMVETRSETSPPSYFADAA